MKSREWQRLATATVLPALPGWMVTRGVVHHPDTEWVLRGLARDSSGFSGNFAVWLFAQPLYVPADHLVFTYGVRLSRVGGTGEAWWSSTSSRMPAELLASVRDQAKPYLAGLSSPADLLRTAHARPAAFVDPHTLEVIAYSAMLVGDDATVNRALVAARDLDPPEGWQRVVTDRLVDAGRVWLNSPSAGLAQLAEWRDRTTGALGLG